MKRAPINYRKVTRSEEKRARVHQIERDFQERVFGEELARVNLDLSPKERLRYIDWMQKLAEKHGVPASRRPFDDLEQGS